MPLSPARRFVLELLHHAQRVPSLPLSRQINVAPVAALRMQVFPRPTWTAIFLHAYALVAQRIPPLRQAYLPWPWPHLYQHPQSEGVVLLERDWGQEAIVLGAKVRAPEDWSLTAIDDRLRYFREAPIEAISYFRQALRVGRLPGPLRRLVFWNSLYLSGFRRAKHWGTFMISSLGTLGVEQHHPLTPLTSYLTFGPISTAGDVTVKIIYDHRVMDGRCVARCLNELDQVLHTDIVAKLTALRREAA